MKISGIIIAKNEESIIEKSIKSLDFCAEVVVVDNLSTDNTKDRAQKLKARVYTKRGDFSTLRNFGRDKARGDWLLYIDADEVVGNKLRQRIIKSLPCTDKSAFYLKRQNFFFGEKWPKDERMIRLMKKQALIKWKGIVHETAEINGEIGSLDGNIVHKAHRSLSAMLEKTNNWSDLEAKLLYKDGHPKMVKWRFIRIICTVFFKYYIKQKGYTVGTVGLIESIYQTFSSFITYAKLWELQQKKDS